MQDWFIYYVIGGVWCFVKNNHNNAGGDGDNDDAGVVLKMGDLEGVCSV